jgi:hypothetical protein
MPERKMSPTKTYRLTVPMELLTKNVFGLYQAYLSQNPPREPKTKVLEAQQVLERLVMQGAWEDLEFSQWTRRRFLPSYEREIRLTRHKKGATKCYDVQVCGQSFLVCSEQSESYVKALAAYVEQKLGERAQMAKTSLHLRRLIGDAMRIADNLFEW